MSVAPKEITPDMLAEARRLYTQTNVPVRDICAMLGIGTYTFHQRLKEWKWPMRSKRIPREPPPPDEEPDDEPFAVVFGGDGAPAAPLDRARTLRLIALLQDATERQLAKLDAIVARIGDEREALSEMQNAMRAQASAGRMLRELIIMQNLAEREPGEGNDEFPRSEDELRSELLRKMDALLAGTAGGVPGEPDGG